MSWVNNLNIRVKLLLVILSIVAVVFVTGFVYAYYLLVDSQSERTEHYTKRQLYEIENVQSIVDDNSKHLVALLSTEGIVREVLANPDNTTARFADLVERLRSFKNISLDQSHVVLDVALYLPSGKRFFSTKSDFTNNSDYSIAKKGSSIPVSGYKMTFDGLEYVASYPIFSEYEQLLGRVEVSFMADQLVNKFSIQEGEDVAMLVRNKELLKYKIKASKSDKVAKYHIMARTSINIDKRGILSVLPDTPIRVSEVMVNDAYAWALKPMMDVTDSNIGYFVFRKDRAKEVQAINDKYLSLILTLSVFIIIFIFLIRYIAIRMLTRPLNQLKHNVNEMALGHFPEIPKRNVNDEITAIYTSIDSLSTALKDASTFADDIRNLNFDTDYKKLSEGDALGDSLIRMRNQLQESEEQKQKIEKEEQLKLWRTEALAKLTETLRTNIGDLDDLTSKVTKDLLSIVGASYGAFYIKDSDYLKPMALIAGDSSKQVKNSIRLGEGLVGETAANKELVYIENVPDDYIQISSGLGETKPKSILLLPLENHGTVNGIVEMASMRTLEDFQLEFLKSAAGSISSSITEVVTNMETQHLLEQSQQQAEELAAQEEEMRQNLEELQTTQEEAYRREIEMKEHLQSFQNALAYVEFDYEGRLLEMNHLFADMCNISGVNDYLSYEFFQFFELKNKSFEAYSDMFLALKSGVLKVDLSLKISQKENKEFKAVISGVEDESGNLKTAKVIVYSELKRNLNS